MQTEPHISPARLSFAMLIAPTLAVLASINCCLLAQVFVPTETSEAIKSEIKAVPCKNDERLEAVRTLFMTMGASESDITIDKYKNVQNLVIRKKGSSDQYIIIGAHYDKVSLGCGAIDNWSGIVALGQVYRTLKSVELKKNLIIVAFGREEDGLIGSHAMASAIKKEEIPQYCAMINLDSFGLGAAQVMENASSRKLGDEAALQAKRLNLPFARARIEGGDADSNSFIAKKIPAVTLHGLTGQWASILHSSSDKPEKVNTDSVYIGYRLALATVLEVDKNPCEAYR